MELEPKLKKACTKLKGMFIPGTLFSHYNSNFSITVVAEASPYSSSVISPYSFTSDSEKTEKGTKLYYYIQNKAWNGLVQLEVTDYIVNMS